MRARGPRLEVPQCDMFFGSAKPRTDHSAASHSRTCTRVELFAQTESCQSFDARLRGRRRCEELRRKGSDRVKVFVRWEPGQLIVAAPMADAATIQVATMFGINNAAMLVFLMQAGFTMLEAGSVRERNVSLLAPLRLTRRASTLRTRRPRSALYDASDVRLLH
jgi:hypothetical protein